MARMIVTRRIHAPPEFVFRTVANIENFAQALPHIVRVEFLTDRRSGVGARFRETRLMQGKEMQTELEVTEYQENDRIRLIADDRQGTIWDTLFTVRRDGAETVLEMTMDARSYRWTAKIFVFLIKGFVRKAVEKDMDMVKAYCESRP